MIRPLFCAFAVAASASATPAFAAVLDAGPGQAYATPSAAIAAAHRGDIVRVHPGRYFDCAVIRHDDVTIEGVGDGAVLTDKPCDGKALLVIQGNNDVVRNLTLQRARVPDFNGAGIRAEGGNLRIENTRFVNNQDGVLSADNPRATIRILSSTFIENGTCEQACAHAIYVGHVAQLDVEGSHFYATRQGHGIKSRALLTTVRNCEIADGPEGTSSYQIDIPNGGSAVIEGNRLEKRPRSGNRAFAINIGEEGVTQPTDRLVIRDNVLVNDTGGATTFVDNLTATDAVLADNAFSGGPVRPLRGDGSAR